KSIALDEEAEILGSALRVLSYDRIILIGHSLGGVLVKTTIANFALTNQQKELRRIRGLVLMASPQLGSTRVPRLARFLSKDLRVLVPHSKLLATVQAAFDNHFDIGETRASRRRHMPAWAVVASNDFWVDRMSASTGLPAEQWITVAGSHVSI